MYISIRDYHISNKMRLHNVKVSVSRKKSLTLFDLRKTLTAKTWKNIK